MNVMVGDVLSIIPVMIWWRVICFSGLY